MIYGKVTFDPRDAPGAGRQPTSGLLVKERQVRACGTASQHRRARMNGAPLIGAPGSTTPSTGSIVGNIYALLAVGLALIFGVVEPDQLRPRLGLHGRRLCRLDLHHLPAHAAAGDDADRRRGRARCSAWRSSGSGCGRCTGSARIAPLLATIGISFVLDQLRPARLLARSARAAEPAAGLAHPDRRRHDRRARPADRRHRASPAPRCCSRFLRFTKLGWAVRATAQDRDAAQQMGVDTDAREPTVFAIASALGGVGGLLVGMYYNHIDPAMSFQATLKGVVAQVIGGMGNVPGAIAGSLLLGPDRELRRRAVRHQLPQPVRLRAAARWCWCCGRTACSRRGRVAPPEPLTGTFIAPEPAGRVPRLADRRR